jgi:hypothetical protein
MSLSQRLKEAEHERRRSAGLPPERPAQPVDPSAPVVDVTESDTTGNVIDLTGRSVPDATAGIAYDPVRNGDASSAFGDPEPVVLDRVSSYPCPRCGGHTQVDLVDQVHQTVSLSCLSCFHMFRIEQH